jgi:hypothetical protein
MKVKFDLPGNFSNRRLDSSLYISWFAYEIHLNVTVLYRSAGNLTRVKIELSTDLKFVANIRNDEAINALEDKHFTKNEKLTMSNSKMKAMLIILIDIRLEAINE